MKITTLVVTVTAGLWTSLLAQGAPNSELVRATLEAQPNCGIVVRYDEKNLYQGFGSYRLGLEEPRHPIPAKLRVAPLNGEASFELPTKDAAIDIITDGETAYILTFSSIEEWDLRSRERRAEYSTYAINGPLAYKEHSEGFARAGDTLIIAHGRLGVSFFNIKTKRLTNQYRLLRSQLPLESMATGVSVQGDLAFVVMDNFHVTKPGDGVKIFRGILIINMKTQQVVRELGGMDPGADAILTDSHKVIVSFGGIPIWKYGMSSLKTQTPLEPEYRLWKFPLKGHPTGTPAMDEKYYYTCYLKAPSYPGENGGYYRNIPMVLDRRTLFLD